MERPTEQEIKEAGNIAYKEAGHNAYFFNGFQAGVEWALKFEKENKDLTRPKIPCMVNSENTN